MANQDAPFGLRPIKMVGGGDFTGGQDRFNLASGYTTSIFQGDLIEPLANGTVGRVPAGQTNFILGVFNGVRYTNPTTQTPTWANTYQQPVATTDIQVFVITDPTVVYEIQANAAFPTSGLFANYDIVDNNPVGNNTAGISHVELAVSTGATTAALPLKALQISTDPENDDPATTNTNVRVIINNSVYSTGTTGV
jgi:hypothetical protein|tara:strand:+ start:60 stop:644 length:585 start_codon:yes stop_codon:yes gene_type:complete